jgi:hypothetical protein
MLFAERVPGIIDAAPAAKPTFKKSLRFNLSPII